MEGNKRLIINLVSCLVSFVITLGINFLLTSYITESVGAEAYGFVALANNFVNYASIITLAINSMASRFVSISYHKKNIKEANQYFNSVLIANLISIFVMLIPSIFIIAFLEKIVTISPLLILSVKILFGLVFLNFFLSLINTSFSVSTFIKNRIELYNLRTMESNLIKAFSMVILFLLFGPNIIFVGIAYLLSTLYLLICNIHYFIKLIPEIKVNKKSFDIKKIWIIFSSGIWNTITKIGQVLTDGLDLLICNWFVTPVAMGQLAIAKTISTCTSTLTASLSSIFHPKMTYYFAIEDKKEEINQIKFSMKIGSFFTNILLGGIVALGMNLLKLWVPTQNIKLIYLATIVTIIGTIIGSSINTLFNVFTVTNRLKINSFVTLLQGVLNIVFMYILLKIKLFSGYEIILISGVSVLMSIIKNLTFTPMYAAKCLEVKWNTFYSTIFNGVFSSIILIATFLFVSKILNPTNWISLILTSLVCLIIGLMENYLILFNKEQRINIVNMFKEKLRRG